MSMTAEVKASGGAVPFGRLREGPVPSTFRVLKAAGISWLLDTCLQSLLLSSHLLL